MSASKPEKKARTAERGTARGPARSRRGPALDLVEDVGEIIAHSHDLQTSLERIAHLVAERMETEVCSLYIYEPRAKRLTLWATEGLSRPSVGKVHMALDEGLTGMVLQRTEPVVVVDAISHPRYKYFPETGEERFHSFLGVPILVKRSPLGVLVVQTLRRRRFGADELRLLQAIAAQVGAVIVQARLSDLVKTKEKERKIYREKMIEAVSRLEAYEKELEAPTPPEERHSARRLVGFGAAPGFGTGAAHLFRPEAELREAEDRRSDDPEAEWDRFQKARAQATGDIDRLRERVVDRLPEVDPSIFDAHRLMLEDPSILDQIHEEIESGLAAESAVQRTVDVLVSRFENMTDQYMRERSTDVKDIGRRLLRNLLGMEDLTRAGHEDTILVADELTPSDLVAIEHARPRAIAMATGGLTSHASILAKSFEIPTVVGVEHLLQAVREGDSLIVDGNSGIVYVEPSEDITHEYERLDREYRDFNRELEKLRDLPAETTDGHRVALRANIGLFSDVDFAKRHGAEGVGLYRTEFPFLSYRDFPDEEEQLSLYRAVLREMGRLPVTVRTLDLAADKYPAYFRAAKEENPFLGWRSIRVSLELLELFKVQLRAILRASAYGRVQLLFPMISSIEEIWRAREVLDEAKAELRREGLPFDEQVPVGIMIEVPSAVLQANELVREVDFVSLGTNDLIQYVLAVDRNNRKVAPLYEPFNPAVLSAIERTIRAARSAGKPVAICGEMAADPVACALLLGLGIDELSMESFSIPLTKRLIRSIDSETAREMADEVLQMSSVKEIKGYLFATMKKMGVLELIEIYH